MPIAGIGQICSKKKPADESAGRVGVGFGEPIDFISVGGLGEGFKKGGTPLQGHTPYRSKAGCEGLEAKEESLFL